MKHPFPAGLAAIAREPETAYEYAEIINAPFPEGEEAISRSSYYSIKYVKHLLSLVKNSDKTVSELEDMDARR
jgi:hypothetical protein